MLNLDYVSTKTMNENRSFIQTCMLSGVNDPIKGFKNKLIPDISYIVQADCASHLIRD